MEIFRVCLLLRCIFVESFKKIAQFQSMIFNLLLKSTRIEKERFIQLKKASKNIGNNEKYLVFFTRTCICYKNKKS